MCEKMKWKPSERYWAWAIVGRRLCVVCATGALRVVVWVIGIGNSVEYDLPLNRPNISITSYVVTKCTLGLLPLHYCLWFGLAYAHSVSLFSLCFFCISKYVIWTSIFHSTCRSCMKKCWVVPFYRYYICIIFLLKY